MKNLDQIFRIAPRPKGSFFLFGPRGSGKSTWLRSLFPDALTIDLLDAGVRAKHSARPALLKERLDAQPDIRVVILDEIQKAPELLDAVHQILESRGRHNVVFAVTGSSTRTLRRKGVNLLAGRLLDCRMHPFMACELGGRFDFVRSLELGLLPVVVSSGTPKETLQAYAHKHIHEELMAEAALRNLGHFSRFLEAVSFSQASVLNMSEVARECSVPRRESEAWLQMLEDMLLAFRLPVFTRRAKRKMAAHDKFYFADCGLFRALRPLGPLDRPEEAAGVALESLVAQHLRAWIDYGKEKPSLHYWRTLAGSEVDFVIYGESSFAAIEVKTSRRFSTRDLSHLKSFRADYPEAKTALLYGGTEKLKSDGIDVLPCEDFLRRLVPGKPLPLSTSKAA